MTRTLTKRRRRNNATPAEPAQRVLPPFYPAMCDLCGRVALIHTATWLCGRCASIRELVVERDRKQDRKRSWPATMRADLDVQASRW